MGTSDCHSAIQSSVLLRDHRFYLFFSFFSSGPVASPLDSFSKLFIYFFLSFSSGPVVSSLDSLSERLH